MSRVITLAAALWLLAGCSLMGLDDIPLKTCANDNDCLVFNTFEGLPEDCRVFYCQDGACLRRPDGQELHDQEDNDCDGLIDEPSLGGAQTISAQGSPAVTEIAPGAELAFSVDATGAASATWWTGGDAWYAALTDSAGQPMSYWRGVNEPGGETPSMRQIGLEEGCYRRAADGSVIEGTCGFSEATVGLTSDRVVVASINTEGCAAGQLRLGYFDRGEAPEVNLRGPYRRSNTYLGIDVNETGACSGGSRPGCGAGGAPCGAARPAMAALDGDLVQALVGWIGDVAGRPTCGGAEVPVEVIAAHVEIEQFGTFFGWATGSNEGLPQTVGTTVGGGPPAIIAVGEVGYLIGFGDRQGRLALRFVPRAAQPPTFNGIDCPEPDTTTCTPEDFEDRSDRTTEPLEDIAELAAVESGGSVDHVALALGASSDDRLELGVAWRSGCGEASEAISFRRVVLSASGGVPDGVEEEGEVHSLSASADAIGPPAIAYAPTGFVVEGFERGGAGPATADSDGGWLVAWAQDDSLVARRLCELDGAPLDADELIELSVASASPDSEGRAPALSLVGEVIRFAFHDDGGQQIISGELSL